MEERDQERSEEEQKDEGEERAEGSEKDAKGHSAKWGRSEESHAEDDRDEGEGEGRLASDARLKCEIEPITGALGRLGAIRS